MDRSIRIFIHPNTVFWSSHSNLVGLHPPISAVWNPVVPVAIYLGPGSKGFHTTAFGGIVYADVLNRAGHRILFNPRMVVVHIYEGWIGERDIRRNNGYAGIAHRQLYPSLAFGWIVRGTPFGQWRSYGWRGKLPIFAGACFR